MARIVRSSELHCELNERDEEAAKNDEDVDDETEEPVEFLHRST